MTQVTVRNLDERVVAVLKMRAELNGHSLEQELRNILAQAARPAPEELLRLVDAVRAMTRDTAQTDSTALVRDDRDAR